MLKRHILCTYQQKQASNQLINKQTKNVKHMQVPNQNSILPQLTDSAKSIL